MDVHYSELRQHLKKYMDLLCGSDEVIKVTRQRGESAYIISEKKLSHMTVKEFREWQRIARLMNYSDALNAMKEDK